MSNGSLFHLSYVIGSVQVNGPMQLLIASLLTVPSPNDGALADEAIPTQVTRPTMSAYQGLKTTE